MNVEEIETKLEELDSKIEDLLHIVGLIYEKTNDSSNWDGSFNEDWNASDNIF